MKKEWYGQWEPITIGQCIYCRSKEGVLREEHVIPYSLGGHFVLKEAVCKRHEAAIHDEFEDFCLSKTFRIVRYAQDYKSSRKHKNKPTLLPIIITKNGVSEERLIPRMEYPIIPMVFPMPPHPGIMIGMPPTNTLVVLPYMTIAPKHKDYEEWEKSISNEGISSFQVQVPFDLSKFMRFLAKMAHGIAVYHCGIDGFINLLPPYILGEDDKLFNVVGVDWETKELPISNYRPKGFEVPGVVYDYRIWNAEAGPYAGRRFPVIRIQLFRYLGAPVYEIIAGEFSS